MNFRLSVGVQKHTIGTLMRTIFFFIFFCMSNALCMDQELEQQSAPCQNLSLANQSDQTAPKKILLVELRSTFEMQFPENMNSILKGFATLYTTPRKAEEAFFEELRGAEQPYKNQVSHYYPQIVQKWLTNNLSSEQVRSQLLDKSSWMTLLYNKKVETTFTEGTCAQALTPHLPTLNLLALCTAQRFLCADFNSAEFEKLKEKYPETLGKKGTFPPAQTHISGKIGHLMCQQEFWDNVCPEKESREKTVFIGNNPEAIAAAEQAHITSLKYDCPKDTLPLHTHLVDQGFLTEDTLPLAIQEKRASDRATEKARVKKQETQSTEAQNT